jgi:prepilin-type processing-associated H-X9-DG protein
VAAEKVANDPGTVNLLPPHLVLTIDSNEPHRTYPSWEVGKMCNRGSTLISVLVVLVMLVVAAVIMYPVATRPARARAEQRSCWANEKQLGMAVTMYSDEYGGKLPLYDNGSAPGYVTSPLSRAPKGNHPLLAPDRKCGTSEGTLLPYYKNTQIPFCPADPDMRAGLGAWRSGAPPPWAYMPPSYTFNGLFLGLAQDKIVAPAEKIVLIDECSATDFVFLSYTAPAYHEHALAEPANFPHAHGLNCLYMDGHAMWMPKTLWPETPTRGSFGMLQVTTK